MLINCHWRDRCWWGLPFNRFWNRFETYYERLIQQKFQWICFDPVMWWSTMMIHPFHKYMTGDVLYCHWYSYSIHVTMFVIPIWLSTYIYIYIYILSDYGSHELTYRVFQPGDSSPDRSKPVGNLSWFAGSATPTMDINASFARRSPQEYWFHCKLIRRQSYNEYVDRDQWWVLGGLRCATIICLVLTLRSWGF